jgi:hypothetical protein
VWTVPVGRPLGLVSDREDFRRHRSWTGDDRWPSIEVAGPGQILAGCRRLRHGRDGVR